MYIDFTLCGKKELVAYYWLEYISMEKVKASHWPHTASHCLGLLEELVVLVGNGALCLNTFQQNTGMPETPLLWGKMLQSLNHLHWTPSSMCMSLLY